MVIEIRRMITFGGGDQMEGSTRKFSEITEIFYILIRVMVTQMWTQS